MKTLKNGILWLITFGLCLSLNVPNTFGDSPDLSLKTKIPDTNIAHHTYSDTEVTTNPLEVSVGDDKYPGIIYNNQKTFNGDTGEPDYQNGSYSYGINGTVYANNFGSTRPFGQSGDVEARKRVSMTNTPGVYKVDFDVRAIDYEPINTYVVIVFDLSSSMTQSTSSGKNKLTEAEKGAVELAKSLLNLNDSNNKTVHVGLVEFSGNVWLKNFTNNNHDTYLQIYKGNTQCTNGTNCNNINLGNPSYDNYTIQYNELSFATNTYFTTDASKYTTDMFHASYNGTNTQGGLDAAQKLLANIDDDNANKFVILMSDGDPTVYTVDNRKTSITTCPTGSTYNESTKQCHFNSSVDVNNPSNTTSISGNKYDVVKNGITYLNCTKGTGWNSNHYYCTDTKPTFTDSYYTHVRGANENHSYGSKAYLLGREFSNSETGMMNGKTINGSYRQNSFEEAKHYADMIKAMDKTTVYSIGYELTSYNTGKYKDASGTDHNVSWMIESLADSGKYVSASASNIVEQFSDIAVNIKQMISQKIEDNIGSPFEPYSTSSNSTSASFSSNIANLNTSVNFNSNYNETTKTWSWTNLGSFYIYMDPESPTGWYYTNDDFDFKYYDSVGELQTIHCDDNPMVWWKQKEHTYRIEYYYDDGDGYVFDEDMTDYGPYFPLEYENGTIKSKYYVEESTVLNNIKTKNQTYEFIMVKDKNGTAGDGTGGTKITKDSEDKYTQTMTVNDNENVIKVYYKKYLQLSLKKVLEKYDGSSLNSSDKAKKFKFKLTNLQDSSEKNLNGSFYYLKSGASSPKKFNVTNGVSDVVEICHNETIIFTNLPYGTKYKINEISTDGFIVSVKVGDTDSQNGYSGTLEKDTNIVFTNTFGYELPETGSSGMLILLITGMFFIGTPVIYIIKKFFRKEI